MKFPEYKTFDLPAIQEKIIEKWNREKTFLCSIEDRPQAPSFIFFEGPPSANGIPGIHHVISRSIKDAVCRYKTQRGYRVERRAGWDTHGLPVELSVEKQLGITKEDIGKSISVEEYNAICRKEVMRYTREWEVLTEKMAYWIDMSRPYVTCHNSYIETVWYLLKDIYNKGLLYKGYSIQPYSPAAGSGLSSHELNQPGCYKDVKDTTCTAQFEIIHNRSSEFLFKSEKERVYFLAWTTTPWTLPSNTALCVGPAIRYIKLRTFNPYTGDPISVIIARDLKETLFPEKNRGIAMDSYTPGEKAVPWQQADGPFSGKQLEGIAYRQLIPWVNPGEGAFRVVTGDFVTTEEGTGIVHIAPTFGDDDNKVAKKHNIPALLMTDSNGNLCPMVDKTGKFYRLEDLDPDFVGSRVDAQTYGPFAGRYVKNVYDPLWNEGNASSAEAGSLDVDICMWLKKNGLVFRIEKMVHNYPHCWRTDKPVLYYPLDSWFIRTMAVKERMMELNDTINWKPASTGTGRFGKWLENLQDWNLSRSRFWGTPLPIWRTEDGMEERCIGSLQELYDALEESAGKGFMASNPLKDKGFVPGDFSPQNYDRVDLHRPYVDEWILASANGKPMRREPDLIDVWFDSGSMPFSQEGLEKLGTPAFGQVADFIAEGVDQTRGWFFTLHAIATMVNDRVCFRNVLSNGLILDKNGNKMSKRLGNTVNPIKLLDTYGADPLRWYMLTNAQPWDNMRFDEGGVDEVRRKFFGTLYNTYSFFALYANVDGFTAAHAAEDSAGWVPIGDRPEIDRWIISLLNTLTIKVLNAYDDYDLTTAGRLIQDFVCDQLSNWYVRLNRKRFWGGDMDADKRAAYQTLFACLKTVALLGAPLAPVYMERLYLDLTGARSVHLELMPAADKTLVDAALEERMDLAQRCTSMVLALRRKVNIKVRQPLGKILMPVLDPALANKLDQVRAIILNEVNVKDLEFIHDTTGLILKAVKPNFKVMGKKHGSRMKEITAVLSNFTQEDIAALEQDFEQGTYTLDLPSGPVALERDDVTITSQDMPGWLIAIEGPLTVALDVTITDALLREGTARELVNRIQNLRKDTGLEVTDKIRVVIENRKEIADALQDFSQYIAQQVLATEITLAATLPAAHQVGWDDGILSIHIEKS
ncbi:MAG: isoleucine--tRNA ligase [Bacteroidales bacterium]|jgi:isoleucyl-tRNA synthetase|nr:isoleucine--tRNA ligase [Bacteroidales bacterium]MDD2264209.1 isoleucine--tRNA ligase [Bacteroidales bacterium]MDD2831319.1 isoleucine--tRNA ligase [Bacteroidales bacterium]MDD3208314.1 isoleucine--tRNA ligase [Bacteroidales bacterium]MDD3697003.1 isoleucine--tRNA ligase [Bacteroidales bacterium]